MKGTATIVALGILTVMLAGCAGNDKDTDGDGLPDALEKRGWEALVYTMTESKVITFTSDPEKVDTDGDGLTDFQEVFVRGQVGPLLDPSNPDTDGDGLTDCQEWYSQVGTCPVLEGFPDYDYRSYKTNPSFVDSDFPSHSRYIAFHLNGGLGFQDHEGYQTSSGIYLRGDGISDYDEIFGYDVVRPDGTIQLGVKTSPSLLDTDGDMLEDGEEAFLFGSDPNMEDSDGDGCQDGLDLLPMQPDRYRVVFGKFRLTEGESRMVFAGGILDDPEFFPTEGHEKVQSGEPVDITHLNRDGHPRQDCPAEEDGPGYYYGTAWSPWINVNVVAFAKDLAAANDNAQATENYQMDLLDIHSESFPHDPESYYGGPYWNPQEDVYRWRPPTDQAAWSKERDSDWFVAGPDGYVHMVGVEAEIWFRAENQV